MLDTTAYGKRKPLRDCLLEGGRITSIERHGKQMALVADDGRCLVIHLGMSGQVLIERSATRPVEKTTHRHAVWLIDPRDSGSAGSAGSAGPAGPGKPNRRVGAEPQRVVFRDPRRFGGLWALPDQSTLRARWEQLGPDSLEASPAHIAAAIGSAKRRAVKAALDQAVIAGVGNIYADEALHRAGIHPEHPAGSLTLSQVTQLSKAIQLTLREAIASGGSSLRDYVDADNRAGQFQTLHRVYGRAGLPCPVCATTLSVAAIAGRTTVFCQRCQPLVHISPGGPSRSR